ncbi:hypothetical protein [Ferrovibrio sp.]|uniref:hypothetical protein n=1 Tax=Ferrovibrio sp. TaxID=1917215 RepID=UPI0025BC8FFF|nr:hypothetical protein [Ferrovibrio sp.]MBX3456422.1 hypothetical protein [Ferrovibrio sp.]
MLVGRWLGWLLCALGLVALGGDILALLQGDSGPSNGGLLASLGEFWLRLDPNGPARLNAHLPDWLRETLVNDLLPLPAAPLLLVLGLLLVLLFRKRAPKKVRPRFGALA